MSRHVDPPWAYLDQFAPPLSDGERQVLRLFRQSLPETWEFYIRPHLNGLRPDLVVLHPRVGVAVFDINECNLTSMDCFAWRYEERYILMGKDTNGERVSLEAQNPINKILLYKKELFELYCPRLDDKAGLAVITAGLIFTASPSKVVERVFNPFRALHDEMAKYPKYYPIVGMEQVASANIAAIFPEHTRTTSISMNDCTAADLRGWLREPAFSYEQRRPLELDERQRPLATTRTDMGYRRIKGPAGAGKSVVLAARASELAAEGKNVLVVSFNITLLNYLRDLAARHVVARQAIRRPIDFLNFHYWCKRICVKLGHFTEYIDLWRESSIDGDRDSVLNRDLALLVKRIYKGNAEIETLPKYDAILVDEGQDFQPEWWQVLRLALAPHGEMVLVADKTQNVYGTASRWTDEAMENAGFRGRWSELKVSYRLPPAIVPHVAKFAKEFLTEEEVDIPESKQSELDLSPIELRWIHVNDQDHILTACASELRRMMKRLPDNVAVSDIVFLSARKSLGMEFVQMLNEKGIQVVHTYDDDDMISRRQKRAFFQGDARIKATTVHSFKGWEARTLIVCVESIQYAEEKAVLYTAFTRLRADPHGSRMTVVSTCAELQVYGASWPDYDEF